MKNKIIHHNDFDGMASAGILANFFDEIFEATVSLSYVAIDYHKLKEYLSINFEGKCAVVDFPFNPTVKWWFDHHKTSFQSAVLKKQYKASKFRYWNTRAKSCPALLLSFFKKYYPKYYSIKAKTYKKLAFYSNLIDSAQYKSPAEVYDFNNPYIAFNHILNHAYSEKLNHQFINSIRSGEYEAFFGKSSFHEKKVEVVDIFQQYYQHYSDLVQTHRNIIEIDYLKTGLKGDRYLGYLFNPDADFTITIDKRGDNLHIGVGYNPWKKNNQLNVGSLLERYGGGGRKNVGAVLVKSADEKDKILQELRNKLKS